MTDLPETRPNDELIRTLQSSLYPGAKRESVEMVLSYCQAAKLDPLQKPVHIVPMRVKTGRKDRNGRDEYEYRDTIMPGIGLYRTQAARTCEHVGTSEPEFGPTKTLGEIEYPEWCKVVVKRAVSGTGIVAEYHAVERWLENYATKGYDNSAPNAMWARRPFAQLAKCAEAQALRRGFPEVGSQPTAEEMEGREWDELSAAPAGNDFMPKAAPALENNPAPTLKMSVDGEKVTVTTPVTSAEGGTGGATPPHTTTPTPPADPMDAGAMPKATSGMQRVVRGKLTAEKSEEVMRAKFGFGIEDMPAAQVNAVLTWLKAA